MSDLFNLFVFYIKMKKNRIWHEIYLVLYQIKSKIYVDITYIGVLNFRCKSWSFPLFLIAQKKIIINKQTIEKINNNCSIYIKKILNYASSIQIFSPYISKLIHALLAYVM